MEGKASSRWARTWMSYYLSVAPRTLLMIRTLSSSCLSRSVSRQLLMEQGVIDATYKLWSLTSMQTWEVGVAYSHRPWQAMWRRKCHQVTIQRHHCTLRQGQRKYSHLIGELMEPLWVSSSRITLLAIGTQQRIRQQSWQQHDSQPRRLQTPSETGNVQFL